MLLHSRSLRGQYYGPTGTPMDPRESKPTVSTRRTFIQSAALAVGLPLVAACAPTSPPVPTATPGRPLAATPQATQAAPAPTQAPTPRPNTTPAAASAAKSPLLPTYVSASGGPKPDFASAGVLYEDGFINYPANPNKALPDAPPGLGNAVTSFNVGLYPPPTSLDSNPAWQEVNRQLNADVQFNIVANPGDYPAKLATLMAGGDLPDLLYLQRGLNAAPNLPLFLQNQCADLSPYLSGDAARDYPFLAAIPTFAWQNAGCVATGRLQMVPIERYAPGTALFKNQTIYDQEIGKDYVPKNADDFKRILQQLNRPQENRWATAAYASSASQSLLGTAFHVDFYAAMFGAPNTWGVEADGKLIRSLETEEFKAAVSYVRDLVGLGLFSPNVLNYNINSARADFIAGRWVVYPEGFGNPWNDFWRRGLQQNPPVNFLVIPPFPAQDGGKPTHYLSVGYQATTALKKAAPDRIKELLRIMNWLAAPFGSKEDLLLTAGIQDVDYHMDERGNPVLTDRGNQDANYVPWKYIVQHPQVMYVPDIPDYAKTLYAAEHVLIPAGVSDPTLGYYSAAQSAKGLSINQAFTDGITDVIAGRRPMSDFDQLVKDWQANGGNEIRTEYADAISASR